MGEGPGPGMELTRSSGCPARPQPGGERTNPACRKMRQWSQADPPSLSQSPLPSTDPVSWKLQKSQVLSPKPGQVSKCLGGSQGKVVWMGYTCTLPMKSYGTSSGPTGTSVPTVTRITRGHAHTVLYAKRRAVTGPAPKPERSLALCRLRRQILGA